MIPWFPFLCWQNLHSKIIVWSNQNQYHFKLREGDTDDQYDVIQGDRCKFPMSSTNNIHQQHYIPGTMYCGYTFSIS